MSTVVTRSLGARDMFDVVAVKVDGDFYANKTGLLELVLSGYSWTNGAAAAKDVGTLDIRVPQFSPNSDFAIADCVELANTVGSGGGVQKYYFSVNNGVPGPSVFVQGDNTWDLMHMMFQLTEDMPDESSIAAATIAATLTYSAINFYDYTPTLANQIPPSPTPLTYGAASNSPSTTLVVKPGEADHDFTLINEDSATLSGLKGMIMIVLNTLTVTGIDVPVTKATRFGRKGREGDSVPDFCVKTVPDPDGWGRVKEVTHHAVTKYCGVKTYPTDRMFVFAVNSGKVDGNGTNLKGMGTHMPIAVLQADLYKKPEWPCDDFTTAVLNWNEWWVPK